MLLRDGDDRVCEGGGFLEEMGREMKKDGEGGEDEGDDGEEEEVGA